VGRDRAELGPGQRQRADAGRLIRHALRQAGALGRRQDVDAVLLIVGEGPATATPFVAASEMKK
jgi:hypothetical protein